MTPLHSLGAEAGQEEDQTQELVEEEAGMEVSLGIERMYPTEFVGLHIDEDGTQTRSQMDVRPADMDRIRTGRGGSNEVLDKLNLETKNRSTRTPQKFNFDEQSAQKQGLKHKTGGNPEGENSQNMQGSMASAHIQILLNNEDQLGMHSGMSHSRKEESKQKLERNKVYRWKRRQRGRDHQRSSLEDIVTRKRGRSRDGQVPEKCKRLLVQEDKKWSNVGEFQDRDEFGEDNGKLAVAEFQPRQEL